MRAIAMLLTGLLLTACTATSGASVAPSASSAAPGSGEVVVFGAASLKGVLERAKSDYEAANPGTTLTISTDSSSALRTQIEQGAPADVFLSADTTNPETLAEAGLTDGEPVVFAANELTIIVPTDNPAGIEAPEDLANDGVRIIAAGEEVPITEYATQVAEALGIAGEYEANVASREDNVKAVVTKIELGEGDAGIVYVTDARASDAVDVIEIPDDANVPATYAGVVVKDSGDAAAARAFLDWMLGADGQAILGEFEFLPPPS